MDYSAILNDLFTKSFKLPDMKYVILALFLAIYSNCNNKNVVASSLKSNSNSEEPDQTEYNTDFLMGKFEPAEHPDFRLIPKKYADKENMYLHKEVLAAFIKMAHFASLDGINLQIRSATRNFDYQKKIWERKWLELDNQPKMRKSIQRAKKILEFSAMPGTSRHHWGTEIDLNSFDNDWFESGEGKILFEWLEANAAKYGFCRPYTKIGLGRQSGYNEEKWHWSYMPLSNKMTEMAGKLIKNDMITGFSGSETAPEIDIVKNYILGVNKACVEDFHNP